ncbi:hypothetical protein SLEP1_g29727 [Rubroshorea leprosula]|uniref:Uncharacterized protein n=1 Tax=Rubroshorea leprosula TaxID=152421 RepID=A0AAV5K7P6_9ROSI|nr:hypothetical protein SLEP1_g29727 [Rubroshorea leprosula]
MEGSRSGPDSLHMVAAVGRIGPLSWSDKSTNCLVHFCYLPCALCQEYRELRNRGFDVSIDLESLPNILQKKYALIRDLDKSLQGIL